MKTLIITAFIIAAAASAQADEIESRNDIFRQLELEEQIHKQIPCFRGGYYDRKLYDPTPQYNCRIFPRDDSFMQLPTSKKKMRKYAGR